MADLEMCRCCYKLYKGDGSCTDSDVPPAEQAQRAAAGRCNSAAQIYNESGHTLKAVGSMVLNTKTSLWKFVRAQDQ